MTMINTPKPGASSMTNASRVSHEVTWDNNNTTWDTETRTWDEMGTIMSNTGKGIMGFLWTNTRFPWLESTPWLSEGGMVNTAKPI